MLYSTSRSDLLQSKLESFRRERIGIAIVRCEQQMSRFLRKLQLITRR